MKAKFSLSKEIYKVVNSSNKPLSTSEIEARLRKRVKEDFLSAAMRGTLYNSTKIKQIKRKINGHVRWFFAPLSA